MIEHNKSYSKFWKVDEKGNMIDITDECPVAAIEFCKDIAHFLDDENLIDYNLTKENTEDIYDYIIEKAYQMPEYIQDVSFKSPEKLKIAFNKLFFKIIQ
tara:strand:+ start:1099 stop:1398 length:300 start_codon:yes stop_codon:yes gene_type:complete